MRLACRPDSAGSLISNSLCMPGLDEKEEILPSFKEARQKARRVLKLVQVSAG